MKIWMIVPLMSNVFNKAMLEEALQFKSSDAEIDIVDLRDGPSKVAHSSEEDLSLEMGSADIVRKAMQAEADGCDGIYITCFADPGVQEAREQVRIPVVGGFQPVALTASLYE